MFSSNLERQDVALALKIIDERNVHALKRLNKEEYRDTIQFLEIIIKLQKILNVKNLLKGTEKNYYDRLLFTSLKDSRIMFYSGVSDSDIIGTDFTLTSEEKILLPVFKICLLKVKE